MNPYLDAFLHVFGTFAAIGLCVAAYVGVMTALQRWWQRGLRRRRERLNHEWSTDPRTITDREIESLR